MYVNLCVNYQKICEMLKNEITVVRMYYGSGFLYLFFIFYTHLNETTYY